MRLNATVRRRWLGAVVLLIALLMLILGETALQSRLHDFVFLAYWFICFALTVTAIVVAMLDARVMRQQTREAARDLLQDTLDQIQTDAKRKQPRRPQDSEH